MGASRGFNSVSNVEVSAGLCSEVCTTRDGRTGTAGQSNTGGRSRGATWIQGEGVVIG